MGYCLVIYPINILKRFSAATKCHLTYKCGPIPSYSIQSYLIKFKFHPAFLVNFQKEAQYGILLLSKLIHRGCRRYL